MADTMTRRTARPTMPRQGYRKPFRIDAGWRAAARYLAVVALVFQIFFPLLHQPRAIAGPNPEGTVVICTGYGVKIVPAADLGLPSHEQAPRDFTPGSWCLACFASHLPAAIVASPIPPLLAVPALVVPVVPLQADRQPADLDHDRPQPRAPPVVA